MTNLSVSPPSEEAMIDGNAPVTHRPDLITIDSTLDVQGAISLRADLLAQLAALPGDRRIIIDLTDRDATALALQMAASLRASLLSRGQFSDLGPQAAQALSAPCGVTGDHE